MDNLDGDSGLCSGYDLYRARLIMHGWGHYRAASSVPHFSFMLLAQATQGHETMCDDDML